MAPPRHARLACLLALAALAGCQPAPVAAPTGPARLMAADAVGGLARLVALPNAGPFAMPAAAPAIVAITTGSSPLRATLALRPVPGVALGADALAASRDRPTGDEGWGLAGGLGAGLRPMAGSLAAAPAVGRVPGADARAAAEAAIRAADAPLRALRPRPRYGLAQAAPAPPARPGDVTSFWVLGGSSRRGLEETQIQARAAYVGRFCDVMIDVRSGTRLDARAVAVGRAFDERVYPTDAKLFGPFISEGVDADGRVTLLVTPDVGEGTLGYFTMRDLFSPEDAPEVDALRRSNQRLMLYFSGGLFARAGEDDLLGTIAHELEHLINATRKLFGPAQGKRAEETWLDEGLATAAMHANGYGLGSAAFVLREHVAGYLSAPERFSLTEWEASGGRGVRSAYGLVHLFTLYLGQRLGEGVYRELVDDPATGIANVEAAAKRHGTSMRALWQDFSAAVLLDGTDAPPEHRLDQADLRGGGLRGPALLALPAQDGIEGASLPYSLRYVLAPANAGLLELGGGAASQAGGWVVTW